MRPTALVRAKALRAAELAPLAKAVRQYTDARTAASTRRAYGFDWRMFERWCGEHSRGAPELVDDVALCIYLAALADAGYAPATVERAAHGIGARLRQLDPTWILGMASRSVLRGIRRVSKYRRKVKKALTAPELRALLEQLDQLGPAGPLVVRNRALLLVGFAGGFRRSELVALNREDLSFSAAGLTIAIGRSKTDQEGEGYEKGIVAARRGEVCPVAACRAWLELTPALGPDAPVFLAMTRWGRFVEPRRRLSPGAVAHVVKVACRAAGLATGDYGGHSLRAGFVTEAALHRKPVQDIMRQTNHKSLNQVLKYIRHADIFTENASAGLLD